MTTRKSIKMKSRGGMVIYIYKNGRAIEIDEPKNRSTTFQSQFYAIKHYKKEGYFIV